MFVFKYSTKKNNCWCRRVVVLFVAVLGFLFLGSCGAEYGEKVEILDPGTSDLQKFERSLMYSARYDVKINAGVVHCRGKGLVIKLYVDQTLELDGLANCGIVVGNIDLAEFNKGAMEETDDNKYSGGELSGIVLRALNPKKDQAGLVPQGLAYFNPPRPNVVNPLSREELLTPVVGKLISEDSSVAIGTPQGNLEDQGSIKVELHSIDDTIPKGVDSSIIPLREDGKVLSFTMYAQGFDKVSELGPKSSWMLFESRKMWMGTNPVAIYKMELSSKIKDLVDIDEIGKKASQNPLLNTLMNKKVFDKKKNPLLASFGSTIRSGATDKIAKMMEQKITITAILKEYIPVD